MILRIAFTVVASVAGIGMGLITYGATSRAIAHNPEVTSWARTLTYLVDVVPVLYCALSIVACWRWHRSRLLRWVTVFAHAFVLLGAVYVLFNAPEFALVLAGMAMGFVALFFVAVLLPRPVRVGTPINEHDSV